MLGIFTTHPFMSRECGTNEIHDQIIHFDLRKELLLDTVNSKVIRAIE